MAIRKKRKTTSKATPLTNEQMDAIADRVSERAETARKELKDPDILFDVPGVSNRITHILKLRHEVEKKVKDIVLAWGGAWAGHSMAPFDTYYEHLTRLNLAPPKLIQEISDFMFFSQAIINEGLGPTDEVYLQVQYAASQLVRELSIILSNTDHDKKGWKQNQEGSNPIYPGG